jgi:hypothetical protein
MSESGGLDFQFKPNIHAKANFNVYQKQESGSTAMKMIDNTGNPNLSTPKSKLVNDTNGRRPKIGYVVLEILIFGNFSNILMTIYILSNAPVIFT